jgi:hypothetical protein
MRHKSHRLASWIYTALFASVATYHFFTLLDSEMPHAFVLRHLVFCILDAAFAALTWMWPRWLLIPIGLLRHHGQFDPLGTLTLFGLATLVTMLVLDEFKRSSRLKFVEHEEGTSD